MNKIRKGLQNPQKVYQATLGPLQRHLALRSCNQYYHSRGERRKYNTTGIDICAADWDNLIILDACRFDYFERAKRKHGLPGKLEARLSRGSQTPEWLYANFRDRTADDLVYVSATAMPFRIGAAHTNSDSHRSEYFFDLQIHELVNVWNTVTEGVDVPNISDIGGDFHRPILAPSQVTDAALKADSEYPQKRLLIHYLQPHDPYIRYFPTDSSDGSLTRAHSRSDWSVS